MKKLIIFDMDGTLLNTLDDILDGVNHSLSKFNINIITKDECKRYIGNGPELLIKRSLKDNIDMFDDVYKEYISYYDTHNDIKTAPYEGINNLLSELKENGYKLAIVSNKQDSAVKLIADRYFKGSFDLSIGSMENVRKKPYPDMVLNVLKQLCIDKEDAIYIGDSDVDVKTALNSNIDGIFVSWGFRDKEDLYYNGATVVVDNAKELIDKIKNL